MSGPNLKKETDEETADLIIRKDHEKDAYYTSSSGSDLESEISLYTIKNGASSFDNSSDYSRLENGMVAEIKKKASKQKSIRGNEETFFSGFFSSFKSIYPVFVLNFFFFLFNNFLNTSVISSINYSYGNNDDIIDAIGFTNTILNVSVYPIYLGFGNILAILGSQAFGAKKYYLMNFILDQTRLFGYISAILVGFLVLAFHPHFSYLFNLSSSVSELSLVFLSYRLLGYFFEYETYVILNYLQIIEKGLVGVVLVILMIPLLPIISFFFISYLKIGVLGAAGAGMTFMATNIILVILLKIYTIFFLDDKATRQESDQMANSKMSYFFTLLQSYQVYFQNMNIILIALFDQLSFEMISTLAIFTPKSDYSAYIVANSIYGAVQCINMAFSVCANVNIGYHVGKGDVKTSKNYFYYLLIQINFVVICACGICMAFKAEILNFLVEPGALWQDSNKLFVYALLVNVQDATFNIMFSTLKTLNENKIALFVTIGYNFFNLGLMCLFAFKLNLGVLGLYYGFLISDGLILLVLCTLYFIFIDWTSQVSKTVQSMFVSEVMINDLERKLLL